MCVKLKGTLSDIVLEGGQASRLSEAFRRIRVKRVTDDVTLHPQKCPFRRRICMYEYGNVFKHKILINTLLEVVTERLPLCADS